MFTSQPLAAGLNNLVFFVPAWATPAVTTFARFRFSSVPGGLAVTGVAPDGEVEDHLVSIEDNLELDFGDAPDGPYPTTITSNGAAHVVSAVYFLGTAVDGDLDGQPNATATGDDVDGTDDEDGVTLTSILMPGWSATVDIVASVGGGLDAWVDWNSDGGWAEAGDRVFSGRARAAGLNQVSFPVPAGATPGPTAYARFRFTATGCPTYDGQWSSGEVEDYEFNVAGVFADGFESADTSAW